MFTRFQTFSLKEIRYELLPCQSHDFLIPKLEQTLNNLLIQADWYLSTYDGTKLMNSASLSNTKYENSCWSSPFKKGLSPTFIRSEIKLILNHKSNNVFFKYENQSHFPPSQNWIKPINTINLGLLSPI